MSEDIARSVQIGETTYTITRFRGLKAVLAGALISRVMREIPELQERVTEFRKRYRANNTIIITPAIAKLPRFAVLGLEAEDFASSDGKIEFPEEPDQGTIIMNVFPDLWELAEKELRKFLAIIVIPNNELEEADDADQVEEVLAKYGKRLIRDGDLDELLELLVIGQEVFKEQMLRKQDRLGKLMSQVPFLRTLLSTEEENNNSETLPESPSSSEESTIPSPDLVPSSSDDSPTNMGGAGEQLSMESLGTS